VRGGLHPAPVAPRAAITAGAAIGWGSGPSIAKAAVTAGAALAADAAIWGALEQSRLSCAAKRAVLFDLSGAAAVEAVENALAVLRAKLVQQLARADRPSLGAGLLLSQQQCHRLRELFVVDNSGRSPSAELSNRPPLPPPPHDDDEVTRAEDRAVIITGFGGPARSAASRLWLHQWILNRRRRSCAR
jgi:hypothetical protein